MLFRSGDYGYLRELRRKVDKLGLEERIQFEGFVEDIRPILSRARVVVLASDLEPLGICLLEAACMGVLVIASSSGGPAEIFASGQNALLFQPGDASSLAKCLETALSSESSGYVGTIRNSGQALARQYSLETYGRRILKVYREVSGR